MEQEIKTEVPGADLKQSNVIETPEVGLSTMLIHEIRAVVIDPKYDHLSTSELIGVLEMIKFEYLYRWLE